jgi:hypothetical protein
MRARSTSAALNFAKFRYIVHKIGHNSAKCAHIAAQNGRISGALLRAAACPALISALYIAGSVFNCHATFDNMRAYGGQ